MDRATLTLALSTNSAAIAAKDLAVTPRTIYRWCKTLGIARRTYRCPDIHRLRHLENGCTLQKEIARQFGVSRWTVWRWCRKLGIAHSHDGAIPAGHESERAGNSRGNAVWNWDSVRTRRRGVGFLNGAMRCVSSLPLPFGDRLIRRMLGACISSFVGKRTFFIFKSRFRVSYHGALQACFSKLQSPRPRSPLLPRYPERGRFFASQGCDVVRIVRNRISSCFSLLCSFRSLSLEEFRAWSAALAPVYPGESAAPTTFHRAR